MAKAHFFIATDARLPARYATVYQAGAIVNGAQAAVTALTVHAQHGLVSTDKVLYAQNRRNVLHAVVYTVSDVASGADTAITIAPAITVPDGALLVNLEAETGGVLQSDGQYSALNYDGSGVTIWSDANGDTAIANATVEIDASGEIGFYADPGTYWIVLRDTRNKVVRVYENIGPNPTSSVLGPAVSVDNAIVRFDGTGGATLQDYTSGAPTISDTGAVVIPTTLNVDGNVDFDAALDVAGAVTMQAAATVGATLGVTGAVTMEAAATVGTTLQVTGVVTATAANILNAKTMNAIRYADKFAGADAGAKIAAAIADLPATGGTVDARGLEGAQTSAANPFNGLSAEAEYLTVLLGACTITTDVQWTIPGRCIVLGSGRDVTTLKASASFPTSTALVRLGTGGAAVGIHGSRVENMTLDCSVIAGSIGVSSTEANEQCGLRNLLIYEWMAKGIHMATANGGAQFCDNYLLEDLELACDSTATTGIGIHIDHSGKNGAVLRRITIGNHNTGADQPDAILVDAGGARFYDIHVERYVDGIHMASGTRGFGCNISSSVSNANLIHLATTHPTGWLGLWGGTTATVLDDTAGTVTEDIVSFYLTSYGGGAGYQVYTSAGRSATITGGVADVQAAVSPSFTIRSVATSGADAIAAFRLYDGNNTGVVLQNNSTVADKPLTIGAVTTGTATTKWFYFGNSGNFTINTANAAQWVQGQISEEITLSTSGATTDSTADLLLANSIIEAVCARVTTTITTATDWSLGDATTAARFAAANSTLIAGTTSVGLQHQKGGISTDATGPVQVSAAKLRITTSGTPGAGAIRVTVFYRRFVAPTS